MMPSQTPGDVVITLADGRVMGAHEVGSLDGHPVFHLNGRGVSRLEVTLVADAARANGIRLIGIDRPGIGLSTAKPGYRITDLPGDLTAIADHLGIGRFAVEGVSAGGAYALACVHQIPDRLTGCLLISTSVHSDLLLRSVSGERRAKLEQARNSPSDFRELVMHTLPDGPDEESIHNAVGEFMAGSPADEQLFRDPDMRTLLEKALAEGLRQGPAAIADETVALIQPWGFALKDISFGRIQLAHGEQDARIPVEAARMFAAELPNCEPVIYPDGGHLSTFVLHAHEFWAELVG